MSKSVTLSSSDAATGRKKNTPMSTSAGATKNHAAADALGGKPDAPRAHVTARRSATCARRALGHPAPLLEEIVHVAVERRERGVDREPSANRLLAVLEHLRGDLLPLGNLGQRHHAVELCRNARA